MNLLLTVGDANPNSCNSTGWSSLHHAAFYGHYETCRVLTDSGAKLDIYNHFGATSLHVAAARGHLPIIRYEAIFSATFTFVKLFSSIIKSFQKNKYLD